MSGTNTDQLLGFAIPSRHSRGRLVRLGRVLDTILAAHLYPAPLAHCLAEALVLTALMGSLLKGEGDQLTMQAQGEGGCVSLLVCDYRDGELRGYIQQDDRHTLPEGHHVSLAALFADAHLAITFDIAGTRGGIGAGTGQRYQGIVPLTGASLSAAVEHYFVQSEQIPTRIVTAVSNKGSAVLAGGFMVQHMPEGEEGRERLHVRLDDPEWEHVAILGESVSQFELIDSRLPLEELVWRLYHEEEQVRVAPGATLSRGCRCTMQHFEEVLARFPKEDRREMANEEGIILVDCAFCSKVFPIQD